MNKTDSSIGIGLIAAMAVCCGAKLLLLGFGLPVLALATGQMLLIAAAAVAAIAIVGIVIWQRRSARCASGACTPRIAEPTSRSRAVNLAQTEAPTERDLVGAGKEHRG